MSDRYQVSVTAQQEIAETALLPKNRLPEVLKGLFERKYWVVNSIQEEDGIWKIDVHNPIIEQTFALNVYVGNVRDEKRNPKEKKIQLNGRDPRVTTPNRINFILGIYCRDVSDKVDDLVFVNWYVDESTNYPGNPSLRGLNTDLIQRAKLFGLIKTDFNSVFTADFIYNILNNPNEFKLSSSYRGNKEDLLPQIIYYGCPGSGKSHKVKNDTEGVNKDFVFRTTFHPDTDYASFVGCYKPISTRPIESLLTEEQLVLEYNKIVFDANKKTQQRIEFISKYANSFIHIAEKQGSFNVVGKVVNDEPLGTYYAEFVKQIATERANGNVGISYKFLSQVFTNAYIQAWKNPDEKVYLIIEEINRGNCAQIFGDLFQLLDRDKNTGVSEYPVKADKDLADYLVGVLGANHEGIKNGELKLPSNLIIYATMNTSDQSLFPMDSAFKRRWDWEYVPIEYGKDKDSYNYIITIGDKEYRWVDFLKIVNAKIYNTTSSEDKQMGNFFIKKSIDAATFVNKVMFYLWNEVCKEEYGNSRNFFRREKDGKIEEFKFTDLFGPDRDTILNGFMENLEVKTKDEE